MILNIILHFGWIILSSQECPEKISHPCYCAPSRYKQTIVVCENADSFKSFQDAVPWAASAAKEPTKVIDQLVISNSHLPRLFAHSMNKYAVRRLILRNNSMIDVDKLAFDNSPMIETLNELEISYNLIESIPDLSRLRNLTSIILSSNQIQRIPAGYFLNFECSRNLRKLDLSGNFLNKLERDSFSDLDNLIELNLDRNFFGEIPSFSLIRLPRLTSLSLNGNPIKTLSAENLPLASLLTLSLEANQLYHVHPEAFRFLKNLLHLYLGGNRLEFVDPEIFRFTPNLRVLSLANNPIKIIGNSLLKFAPNLIRIDLQECQIRDIDNGAFQSSRKIALIDLHRNRIQKITSGTFQGLTSLNTINLKSNVITNIETMSFANLPNLRLLDISSNNLTYLDPDCFFDSLQRIVPETSKFMYIYDNPWNCDTHLVPFVEYIKSNYHLITDAPGQIPSICQHPPALSGIHLKHSDMAGSTGGLATSTDAPHPRVSITDSVKYEESGGDHDKTVKRTNVSTIILSVILGILIVALILLLLVRYLKSKQRRDRKLDEETFRMNRMGQGQFTRRTDSLAPPQGSAFPVESGPSDSNRHHNGAMNRPWYHVLNFKV